MTTMNEDHQEQKKTTKKKTRQKQASNVEAAAMKHSQEKKCRPFYLST